jgi:tungstate transport system permease protein
VVAALDAAELLLITGLTLRVSLTAVALSSALGIPVGILIATGQRRRKALTLAVNTAMGTPPVLLGLVLYLLLSRQGPLGFLGLLFTPEGMILSQFLLTLPITTGLTISAIESLPRETRELIESLATRPAFKMLLLANEAKLQLLAASLTALARAVSEVGSVIIVGGNIRYYTRVLTTAMVYHTNAGEFEAALWLGAVLALVYLSLNAVVLAVRAAVMRE